MPNDLMASLPDFENDMKASLGSSYKGDSKLDDDSTYINQTKVKSDTDMDNKTSGQNKVDKDGNPIEDEPDEPGMDKVIEKPILDSQTKGKNVTEVPKYRPRLNWGDTDNLLNREKDEVHQANIVIESMSIEEAGWGNGAENSLYKMTQVHDNMRYGNTFSMPEPSPPDPLNLPSKFIQLTSPVFVSGYAPTGIYFNDVGHDPSLSGQYSRFKPSYTQTVYPSIEQTTQTGHYPHLADIATGGQEQSVGKFDYVTNMRFTN
jgi:hypothetical protein